MGVGPNVSSTAAAAVICLVVGGIGGYFANYFTSTPKAAESSAAPSRGGGGGGGGGYGGGGGGMMGGGGGYGGGGGRGGPPAGGMALARLVRNLATIEEVQGKGLKPDQAKALAPILAKIKAAATLPADEADKQVAAIQKVLTPDQQAALDTLQPQFGGGGRGGAGGGGGYGGGGGRPDPEKPFANERNQKALDGLLARLSKG